MIQCAYHGGQSSERPSINDLFAFSISVLEYSLDADAPGIIDDTDSAISMASHIRGAMTCGDSMCIVGGGIVVLPQEVCSSVRCDCGCWSSTQLSDWHLAAVASTSSVTPLIGSCLRRRESVRFGVLCVKMPGSGTACDSSS